MFEDNLKRVISDPIRSSRPIFENADGKAIFRITRHASVFGAMPRRVAAKVGVVLSNSHGDRTIITLMIMMTSCATDIEGL
jgi:hypothetical protein